jgi:hypothetical protein
MDDFENMTPAQRMAYLAEKRTQNEAPIVKPVSYRVPLRLLAEIDALASITRQSRNTTITTLIEAGVQAVRDELPDTGELDAIVDHLSEQYLGEED